jgi:hypothetical protein
MDDKECSKLGGGFRRRVPVVAVDKRVPELAVRYLRIQNEELNSIKTNKAIE